MRCKIWIAAATAANFLCVLALPCQTPTSVVRTGPAPCSTAPDPADKGKRFPNYLADSDSQLKSEVPALRGIKFAKGGSAEDAAAVLKPAGDAIVAMLPRIPRLIANEELSQTAIRLPYTVSETSTVGSSSNRRNPAASMSSDARALEGEELQKALHGLIVAQTQRSNFSYRIQSNPDAAQGAVIEEFRTDSGNDPVDVSDSKPGSPRGIGFGNSWLLLVPANQRESRFRLLGSQKIDGHETGVLAFAQIPGGVRLPAEIAAAGASCAFYTQGIVWIDQTSHEIVRLQTDLLAPLSDLHLRQMRSEIRFDEIKISERSLALPMPSAVEISWMTDGQAGGELHRYTNYRLFNATSRIITHPVN